MELLFWITPFVLSKEKNHILLLQSYQRRLRGGWLSKKNTDKWGKSREILIEIKTATLISENDFKGYMHNSVLQSGQLIPPHIK